LFRCQVFHSATFHTEIPKEFRKLRFACPAFELLMDEPPVERPPSFPVSFNVKIHFPPIAAPHFVASLMDLAKIARVLRYMVEAPQGGIRIELRHRVASWTLPSQMQEIQLPGYAADMSDLLEKTIAVASAFGIDLDTTASLASIIDQQSRVDLLWRSLHSQQGCFPAKVPLSTGHVDLDGKRAAILFASGVVLGDHRLIGAFAICGSARQQPAPEGGMELELVSGEVRPLWTEVVASVACSPEAISSRLAEAARELMNSEVYFAAPPSVEALSYLLGVGVTTSTAPVVTRGTD
jgi:hypothetical protein